MPRGQKRRPKNRNRRNRLIRGRPNGRGRARGRATGTAARGRHDTHGHLTKRMILCIHFLSSSNLNCDIY